MKQIPILGRWTLSGAEYQDLPAIVPGCVHTDLRANGLLPDYFYRKENDNCQWVEKYDWTYTCVFDSSIENTPATLVFEGLDTYATVSLNGIVLGDVMNMFIPHRFDVTGMLRRKNNQLTVAFRSPVKEVEGLPPLEGAFTTERLYTRRLQCTYYWDWVDRFVTCGIFAPVYFVVGADIHVADAYIYTRQIDSFGAQLGIDLSFEHYEQSGIVEIDILDNENISVFRKKQYVREPLLHLDVTLPSPKLWWPRGYGEQPMYLLRVTLGENVFEQSFGIRTLRVAEIPDALGSEYDRLAQTMKEIQKTKLAKPKRFDLTEETAGFVVLVNGKRIYCRGANWVPSEPFPSEWSEDKVKAALALAAEGNVNMIRVWGGGMFEKDFFYDECDRLGILVTQDFLMACGAYPQNEPWFLEELKKESAHAAKQLRNHPCLAWWSGDNENATYGTDLQEIFKGRTAALVGLEPQVRALDPTRRFHVSSPYGGTPYMSITRGTTHTTNFFDDIFRYLYNEKCKGYKEHLESFLARFIVEEPIYGMPQRSTLRRFMTEEDLCDPTEDVLRAHSKTNPSVKPTLYDYARDFTENIFGTFRNDADRLFKYEYLQYEWVRVVFENCRRNTGYNDGLVFWMLNDCWPASMSWSIIDYYNLPKAAWYSFKRCAKPVIGSLKKEDSNYRLTVCSDGYVGTADVVCHTDAASDIFRTSVEISGYGTQTVELPFPTNTAIAICDITVDGTRDRCFYKEGLLPLNEDSNAVRIINCTEHTVTLKASRYVHAVFLEGDYIFSDNYFSMYGGEEITLTYRKAFPNEQTIPFAVRAFTCSNETC